MKSTRWIASGEREGWDIESKGSWRFLQHPRAVSSEHIATSELSDKMGLLIDIGKTRRTLLLIDLILYLISLQAAFKQRPGSLFHARKSLGA